MNQLYFTRLDISGSPRRPTPYKDECEVSNALEYLDAGERIATGTKQELCERFEELTDEDFEVEE